ncbi:hypothetical protein MUSASHINO07_14280 [Gemella sp. Musashino-2025]
MLEFILEKFAFYKYKNFQKYIGYNGKKLLKKFENNNKNYLIDSCY